VKTPIDAEGHPGATVALLNSGKDFAMLDLWSITLNGGGVIRWHGGDDWIGPQSFNGNTWAQGPGISRQKISTKLGLEVAAMDAKFIANTSDEINGVPLIPFVTNRGFDGATVQLLKAFLPAFGQPITGCTINFAGRVTEIKDISRVGFTMTVSAWTVLLNVSMGPDVFQAGCLNTHYDADCGLTPTNIAGAVTSSPAPGVLGFATNLNQVSGYFSKGTIVFTSGANAGLSRAISTYSNGQITLAFPLPNAPAPGDTFNAVRGCLLTMADCTAQNNLIHFRGQPFTPPAVTGVINA
jgi:uncharacterized phage protein (TIGR02218 family)